jgi:hypothetical protein
MTTVVYAFITDEPNCLCFQTALYWLRRHPGAYTHIRVYGDRYPIAIMFVSEALREMFAADTGLEGSVAEYRCTDTVDDDARLAAQFWIADREGINYDALDPRQLTLA